MGMSKESHSIVRKMFHLFWQKMTAGMKLKLHTSCSREPSGTIKLEKKGKILNEKML